MYFARKSGLKKENSKLVRPIIQYNYFVKGKYRTQRIS